jgi:hypothetical protein
MSTISALRRTMRRLLGRGPDRGQSFFRLVRRWSNVELAKYAPLFDGPVINVSAWADQDKEGRTYRGYFRPGTEYWISNIGTSEGEMQGWDNEFFLDLEVDLPPEQVGRFATVFNHTSLEHIWDFRKAFANLCALSSDAVVVIVPWLQPLHADYGDFWRFSPQAVVRLFEEQGMKVMHLNWNRAPRQSVYVFAIAVRDSRKWQDKFPDPPIGSSDAGFHQPPPDAAGHQAFDF